MLKTCRLATHLTRGAWITKIGSYIASGVTIGRDLLPCLLFCKAHSRPIRAALYNNFIHELSNNL